MAKKNLPFREEPLSPKEKKTLLSRFYGILLFGICIASVAYYFIIFNNDSAEISIPVILFSVFFFGILAFILFIHGRNAFQTVKIIYTGEITNKFERAFSTKNSDSNITYHISLDGEEFIVDLYFYNNVKKGEKVELHCFKNDSVFDVKSLQITEKTIFSHPKYQEININTFSNPEYNSILKKQLISAFTFRFLIGGIVISALGAALLLVVLTQSFSVQNKTFFIQVLTMFLSVFWIFLNFKIIQIIRDFVDKIQLEKIEKIIDLQMSNMPKPSKNSVQSYRSNKSRDIRFFYVETANHWVRIDENKYNSLKTGDDIKVVIAKNSKVVLDVIIISG